ncbi:MAG: metallophosphoesterase family protein [Actinomycetota bacterium]
MSIAVISDIHGNLMALDAVLTDIESQGAGEIWCGGDIAWGGPWPQECIARVQDACSVTIKGNTDIWVTGDPQGVPESARDEHKALAAAHDISEEEARWLLNLPLGHSGQGSVLLVHGTPQTPFDGPMPDDPAARFAPYQDQAQIVVYGHVHRAFTRRLADGTIVCNTGSVGLPMDGDRATYLLLHHDGPDWVLIHRQVNFDRRAAIAHARRMEGPIGPYFLKNLGED